MPLLLMLWCNVVKRNWTIILMQTVLVQFSFRSIDLNRCILGLLIFSSSFSLPKKKMEKIKVGITFQ